MPRKPNYQAKGYQELYDYYVKRCGWFGVDNPRVPKKRRDLIKILQVMDFAGVPKRAGQDPMGSVRKALLRGFRQCKGDCSYILSG